MAPSRAPTKKKPQLNPADDPSRFDELKPTEREAVLFWISQVMKPVDRVGAVNSFLMKGFCEREAGFALSNGAMKGAMLAAGHQPTKVAGHQTAKATEQNPLYRTRPLLPNPRGARSKATLAGERSGQEIYTIKDADLPTQEEFGRLCRAARGPEETTPPA